MATGSATFTDDWMIARAHSTVEYLDFGFPGASKVINNQTTTTSVTGKSVKVIVHYNFGTWPPKSFLYKSNQDVEFPADAHVTITGGGHDDFTVEATDLRGRKAVWVMTGGHSVAHE